MIHLLYCGNRRVFDGCYISALSAAIYASEPLTVSILTMDLSDMDPRFLPITPAQGAVLERALRCHRKESLVRCIDGGALFRREMSESPNLGSSYTPYAMLRLFADLLPLPDRVLYLDVDTVCHGDIAPLFHLDLQGAEYGAAPDYLGRIFIRRDYVNSGVLLLDLARIRRTGLFGRARRVCATVHSSFPDQNALYEAGGHCLRLPRCYNEQRKARSSTVIRHFSKTVRLFPYFRILNVKPWQTDRLYRVCDPAPYHQVLDQYQSDRAAFSGDSE